MFLDLLPLLIALPFQLPLFCNLLCQLNIWKFHHELEITETSHVEVFQQFLGEESFSSMVALRWAANLWESFDISQSLQKCRDRSIDLSKTLVHLLASIFVYRREERALIVSMSRDVLWLSTWSPVRGRKWMGILVFQLYWDLRDLTSQGRYSQQHGMSLLFSKVLLVLLRCPLVGCQIDIWLWRCVFSWRWPQPTWLSQYPTRCCREGLKRQQAAGLTNFVGCFLLALSYFSLLYVLNDLTGPSAGPLAWTKYSI